MDCFPNQYHCESAIYMLSFIALEFNIDIDRAAGENGNEKYVVDGLSARDKKMPKLEKILRIVGSDWEYELHFGIINCLVLAQEGLNEQPVKK